MTNIIKQYPIVMDNFISNSECKVLLDLAVNNSELFEVVKCPIPRWNKRNIHTSTLFQTHKDAYDLMLLIAKRIQNKIREVENDNNIWLELPMYSRWLEGDELDPPHADNVEQDGKTPNASPWRSHGIVLYLNNDFNGGEIFYKNHNLKFKPTPKTCAIHRAGIEDTHGVVKVQNGTRHTIVSFACTDRSHVEQSKHSFLDGHLNKI